jgi:predicted Zn-dependent protease
MTLRGERELQRIARLVLGAVDADQAEVYIENGTSALTRFASNYVHQNVQESDLTVSVRAVIGKRIGIAASDSIEDAALVELAQRAVALARLQQPNDEFESLPGPTTIRPVNAYLPGTAEYTAEQRADVVRRICEAAKAANLVAAGAYRTGFNETAVMNTLGVWAYHQGASADINTVLMGETSSGHAERLTLDAAEIDGDELAAEAVDKARRGVDPQSIDPGVYEVILEEYAVADIMDYFADLSFGAQAFIEKRSFMSGRLNERVLGENITIWDDGASPSTIPSPFDYEGVARQNVPLIENGDARGVVWDTYYGGIGSHESTGHALPAGWTYGPMPGNLFLAPGDSSKEEMVSNIERGVWVSRFWYTRPVHPLQVILTGMTRDGTFLIENGRITRPIRNLRFTQSYVEAMSNVLALGRATRLLPSFAGACRVPALHIKGWNFTGATDSAG